MMRRFRLLCCALLLASCSSEPTDPRASLGSLRVTVVRGFDLDPNPYTLALDDRTPIVLPSGGLVLPDLTPGPHRLELKSLPSRCQASENPRAVTVEASRQLAVQFSVVCRPATGDVGIFVSTTGFGADPGGYAVSIDGGLDHPLRLEDSLVVDGLAPGPHEAVLGGVGPSCQAFPSSPIRFAVVADFRVDVHIAVTCSGKIGGQILADDPLGVIRIDPDGGNRMPLSGVATDGTGRWSPDGSKVAFVSRRDGNAELYLMNADGSNQVRLTSTPEDEASPSWSPDGTQIAFSYADGSGVHIAVVNVDGTGRRILVAGGDPAWSPNGDRIAFVRTNRTNCFLGVCVTDVRSVKADGTGDILLIAGASQPAWSPNGHRLAYARRPGFLAGPRSIQIMTFPQRAVVPIGNSRDGSWPIWAPSGTFIAFTDGSRRELMIVDLLQTGQPISTGVANVRATSWKN